jgi:hypothetical protein
MLNNSLSVLNAGVSALELLLSNQMAETEFS